uniref:RNA-directed DNA polymerase n=1 Tax=Fagus sylvatica TaxID=28930 RepID=A0A2N9G7Q9_FAGSY
MAEEEEKKKATISKRQKEIYPALSLSKAAQTLPTPRRPAFHIPRPSRTEPRQFQATANPSPTTICLADQEEDDYARQPEDAVLRHRIQDLLDQGVLKFRIEGVINTIGAEKDEEVDITSTKIPWEPLFHELKKRGLLPAPRAPKESTEAGTCQYHPGARDHNLQGCEEFKKEVAALTRRQTSRQGWKEFEEDFEKFCERKKEELGKLTPATPLEMSGPDPVVIRYATKEKVVLQTASVSAVQSSEKVPSVVIQVPQPFPYQDSKKIPWNYGMKVISTRESQPKTKEEVVGNLTSGLGGNYQKRQVLHSGRAREKEERSGKGSGGSHENEGNRGRGRRFPPNHQEKALLKVLNEAYVPEDITGPSFENMVTSILVTNQLTFSDDELPRRGELDIDPTRVRVNSMVVRAFDGTRREVLGEIDLPVEIGPQVYDINFQVLRIDSPYNLLLGRPWLHTAGAVPSSLHQKMKLIIGNQLVTILAEEPISICNDGEIPYIDGCAPEEASFHSFEFVTVIHRVAAVEPRLSKAGIMVAKEFVKAGFQPGQGFRLCEPRKNHNCDPGGKQRQLKGEKWPERKMAIPHIRATFPASAMFQVDEGDVDELALLFTEDLNVNAITTEGDSAAFPVHADQHEEIDLEDFLDGENLKGYRIDEETLDEDTWEDDDLPDLLPHLMVPRGLDTLEFEIFCEHGDPESHLRKYREKMALHTNNEFLMISTFHESLPECAVTWFYQLKNLACWGDLARAFLDRYRHNIKAPPPSNIATAVAEEEYAGPMVEGLSIHTIAEEEDSTTTPLARRCQQGEDVKTWTCVPLLQRVSSSNEITRKTSNDPHVSKIDNKTDCSLDNIDNSDEEIELPSDILEALERQDEGSKPNIEELEIVNLANEGEEPREVKIGTRCATEQKEALIALLREFHEIFAWSYQDMPGLDTDIVVHKIPLKPECKPVKQALRRMKPEVILKIKEEVEKQLKAGFLSTVTYSDWVANIVPVPKKDGKVRMCVDYRDLNRASPKDNFPLPHIDTLVDNTATNVVFSFMDGFSGYNQIKMAEEDKSKTAFVTHWGTFVYDVMPFGLKNAGATYQRAMVTLFHDMIHHEIEVYVDDMIAKSRTAQDHLTDLRKLFQATEEDVPSFYTSQSKKHPWAACWDNKTRLGRKEQAIYYLSKKFTEPETRYLLVEKTCCALAWASKKLRQYMLYYTTWLVSRNGPDQAIKGQAIADYLADYPSEQLELMDSEFPDEDVMTVDEDNQGRWKLYFDGAANAVGSGIGAVLVSPKGQQTPIAVKLGFDCTNNMTEYEACIVGLQAALEFGAYELEVFGDSLLIVSQTNGEWQARDPKLIPYQRYISRLVPKFKYVTFTYTPRAHNHFADALATLASLIKLKECMNVEAEIDNKPWYYDIKRFIQDREYPSRATENEKKYIRRMAFQFFLSGEILYKRTHDATLLRCVDAEEANRHVQTCHKCQMYQNSKNAPPQYLHTMASPWPFSAWGMDVIGAITPKASNGHEFILVAIDYFTKWVEACSFKNVTQVAVTRFVKNNIICRYGMPEMLITDNASNLNNRMMDQLCQQFKIQHHNSAPYRPKMNGAVEAANKNVKKILSKMTETYKDWHEHLPYALCLPNLEEAEWAQARYEQLNFIDEKRLAALCHGQLYQRRIERAYNKKARPRTFQPGDLVLKKRNMALSDPRGKFAPSYEGPYVVKKAFSGGAIILADMDGEEFRSPINSDSVIKPGKQRKSVRTLPSDGNYHGYGENLGRGAIGKSNVESWTWRLSAESPQGSGKGRIPLIMLLPDGASSSTQRIHHLVNLVERSDHRETLLIEPRSIGLKSIMHQIQLSLQTRCHPGER